MAYSTEEDILKRIKLSEYNKLVAVEEDDEITSNDILTEAIATADSIIDSYLQGRIEDLPLDDPPKSIVQCSCDIVIYNLHSRIQYIDIPEWINQRYLACMKWLSDISKGLANIDTSTLTESETESGGVSYGNDRDTVFGSGTF